MVSQKECIDEIKRCLDGKDSIRLRNASRAMADYAKITFREIGKHYPPFAVIKDVQIKHRYRLLTTVVPELRGHEKMFLTIEDNRMKVDHSDIDTVPLPNLQELLRQIESFQSDYDNKILPKLQSISDTPKEKIKEEWKTASFLINVLKGYSPQFIQYSDFGADIAEIENTMTNIDSTDDRIINDHRVKLKDLQFRITAAIQNAENEIDDLNAQAAYDQWRGK